MGGTFIVPIYLLKYTDTFTLVLKIGTCKIPAWSPDEIPPDAKFTDKYMGQEVITSLPVLYGVIVWIRSIEEVGHANQLT